MKFRIFTLCLLLSCLPTRLVLADTHLTVSTVIPVGNSPQQAVITADGAEVYVTNYNDNTVSVINTATNAVSFTLSVGGSPSSLAVSPDGSKVYVGDNARAVSIINTLTKVVTTIATPGPVRQLALTPDGSRLYLAMEFSGVWQLVTATNSLSQVSSMVCPEGVAVTPNGSTLYVNYQCGGPGGSGGHDAIGVFNAVTNAFLGSITGLPNVGQVTAISPNGLQLWENGGDACISPSYDHVGCPANPGVPEGVVNIIGTSSNTLIRSLGGVGGYMSFSPDSSRVFLVVGNNLEIIDTTSFAIVDTVEIPASGSVVFTSDRTHAYAPLPSQNGVAVLTTTNRPPAAQCKSFTFRAGPMCTATGSIDNGSFDPDGDPITLVQTPAGPYGLGTTPVVLTVTDNHGLSSSCTASVIVVDKTPPYVISSLGQTSIWPPNHDLIDVGLAIQASDNCAAKPIVGVSVFSNEPEEANTGDGNFSPDARNVASGTLQLRSERMGDGNGRVYLIVGKASDGTNAGFVCSTVVVPHSQSRANIDAVNAAAAAAQSSCQANQGTPPPGYIAIGSGPVIGPKQ